MRENRFTLSPMPQLATRPVRLHLDTSDYAVMYCSEPGTPAARVRDELKEFSQSGRIEIGLSYHVVFELLQKASPEHREDRLERARLLTELCGQNAFPYPSDLGQGFEFSKDSLWVPRVDLEEIEIEQIIRCLMHVMNSHPDSNRHMRKVHSKREYFDAWVRDNSLRARRLYAEHWPLLFARAFAEGGELEQYILGEMNRSDANDKLRFHITDPVSVYTTWFELYGRDNPIVERREKMARTFVLMLEGLQSMLNESVDLRKKIDDAFAATGDDALVAAEQEILAKLKVDLKTFRAELLSPQELCRQVPVWKDLLGEQGALLAAQILYAFHREKRQIRESDAIDFMHAMYLPHADLWRGDRAFSDLLIKHKVDFSEHVVPALVDLPCRIESEIAKLSAAPPLKTHRPPLLRPLVPAAAITNLDSLRRTAAIN